MKVKFGKFILRIYCCILFVTNAVGQQTGASYTFVTLEEKFPKSAITSIIQDEKGLLWIATNFDGLYQYNGTDLKAYKHNVNDSTSINSSIINTLFIDSRNRIWIGTDEGLNIYNRDFDSFEKITFTPTNPIKGNIPVFSIEEANDGSIFIGTPSHGLYMIDSNLQSIASLTENVPVKFAGSVINALLPMENGDMLIGTNVGLFYFDAKSSMIRKKLFVTEKGSEEINYSIESLFKDIDNNILVGTFANGLVRIEQLANGFYHRENFRFTDKRIFDIKMLNGNTILCATENDGLFVLDNAGAVIRNYTYDKSDPYSIGSNSIWSILVDDQKRIWLGYYNNGIGVFDALHDKFLDLQSLPYSKNSLQSPSVTGIVQDNDNLIWIGMDGGGIDIYDPVTKKFTHLYDNKDSTIKGLDKLDIQTIFLDKKGNLWAGTWSSGIYYLSNRSNQFINYNTTNTGGKLASNSITSFSENSEGIIWIATYFGGLHSFDPKTTEFDSHPDKSFNTSLDKEGHIRSVLVDRNDTIWLGTPKGLLKTYKVSENKYETESLNQFLLKSSKKQNSLNIRSLLEDAGGNIWAGSYGKGLFKIDKETDEVEWFGKKDGLLLENISAIIEDHNKNIWISGEAGLVQMNTQTKVFSSYNKEDGLLSNNYNYNAATTAKNGLLYFGNYKGVDYFNPDNINQNTHEPSVYFTDFKLFNKSVNPQSEDSNLTKNISETEHLILSPKQFVFTIEFAAINFTRASKNQYAYYLEGFEDEWNYVGGTRSATYTNLSPGDYTFHVKASNNDGVWTKEPVNLSITVLAPWWATNWAIFGYALLIIGIAFLVNRFLNKRIEEKRILKFERVQRQQEEILNQKKIQFFTNISHEFRTPLTLIINPIMDILENNNTKIDKALKEKHNIIFRNAQRLKNLIDELMDFRKLNMNKLTLNASRINAFNFVKEIAEHFEEEAFEKNILLSTETDGKEFDFWGDPGLLEKVIYNLLSNAFKATPENGVISITVYECKEKIILPLVDTTQPVEAIEISIEDTGTGIAKEDIEHIFERFYRAKDRNQQYYGGSGTGIGLELVQSFVQLHKGEVKVESTEGIGTKFTLFFATGSSHLQNSENTIPLSVKEPLNQKVSDENFENSRIDNAGFNQLNQSKKTVLIVEDNLELRNYLKNKLRPNYNVAEAENGIKGFEMALKGIPDMIITDVIMPQMDGLEFSKLIKKDLRTSHIPIIMITAKTMDSDKIKGIDSGADAYMNKPFDMKLLKSYIKRLIESRQQFLGNNINDKNKITLLENTTSIDKSFIQKVFDYINENISENNLNVEHLADDMSLSRSQLYRKIKALTGMTVNELIRKIRLERAKQLLENGSESVSEVGFKVGFSSASYFSKCFKNEFGMLPTEMKTSS